MIVSSQAPVPLTRSGSRTPIFAVHNGAGTAYPFIPLARALGSDQPFLAFHQFEPDGRREPLPTIEAMAGAYIDEVRALRPTGPYVLVGMCATGCYVAYEMAHGLEALGGHVEVLVLFDPMDSEVAQECVESHALVKRALSIASALVHAGARTDASTALTELVNLLSQLGMEQQLLYLEPRHLHQLLELFATNHDASLAYTPRPYPGRALIFIPALSRGDDRLPSGAEWARLIPAAEVHNLPIDRGALYADPETVARVATTLRAAFH